jgi:hypothetical protein
MGKLDSCFSKNDKKTELSDYFKGVNVMNKLSTALLWFLILSTSFISQTLPAYFRPEYFNVFKSGTNSGVPLVSSRSDRGFKSEQERKYGMDYYFILGPEIPVTGLSGYYDYQMNGIRFNHIYWHNSNIMYAVYMTSYDSMNFILSRRTRIAFSDDDGSSWNNLGSYPFVASSFPSVSGKSNGSGVFTNIYNWNGYINFDIAPGAGSFNGVSVPSIWNQVSRLSNGNMLVAGLSYPVVNDSSIVASIFNSVSDSIISITRLVSPVGIAGQSNISMAINAVTGGKAIILVNPCLETGGNWGSSRIYCVQSTDNGITWGSFTLLFNPHIISVDSIAPYRNGSCDIIMDASGNYYWAFNSLGPSSLYKNGRLLVGKNNTEPQIIAGTGTSPVNPIAQIPDNMRAQAFISNFDHPCLALSIDGQYIFISYSVPFRDDTLNSFNKCHIFLQYAKTSDMIWSAPFQVNQGGPASFDQRYASINKVAPVYTGQQGYVIYMVYQKDSQPGSFAYLDNAPESRASLIYRKILFIEVGGIKRIGDEYPKVFSLGQNYPNPFNPSTNIIFDVPRKSNVQIRIYDIQGHMLENLVNSIFNPGKYSIDWDGSNYASGVYFYKLSSEGFTMTRRMILLK